MRKKIIAGNWKMNNDLNESQSLVSGIISGLGNDDKCEVIVCPPFTSLSEGVKDTASTVSMVVPMAVVTLTGIFIYAQYRKSK